MPYPVQTVTFCDIKNDPKDTNSSEERLKFESLTRCFVISHCCELERALHTQKWRQKVLGVRAGVSWSWEWICRLSRFLYDFTRLPPLLLQYLLRPPEVATLVTVMMSFTWLLFWWGRDGYFPCACELVAVSLKTLFFLVYSLLLQS